MSRIVRQSLSLVVVSLLLPVALQAGERVALQVVLKHTSFLLFEPIRVEVRLTNTGDIPLTLGVSPLKNSWELDFDVWRNSERLPLGRLAARAIVADKTIGIDETQSFMVDLSEHFDLFGEGNYRFQCMLVSGDVKLTARLMSFSIVRGIELKRVEQALPGYAGEPRVYSLRYWRRDNRDKLFLVVDAPFERTNYGVFDLGVLLRMDPPALSVSRDGLVTVLHQSGNDMYVRSTLRSERNGVTMEDQTYQNQDGRPHRRTSASEEAERALERMQVIGDKPAELQGWWLLDDRPFLIEKP